MNGNEQYQIATSLEPARELAEKKQWSEAADVCKQALLGAGQNTFIRGELGWYLSRAKRYDEAIIVYKELIQLEPSNAKWPYMLGYQYYDQQVYSNAVLYFDQALSINPDYIKVLYRKGYALSQLDGRKGDALTSFEKCRSSYRKFKDEKVLEREQKYYVDACYQQGKLLVQCGKLWLAQQRLAEAAELQSDSPDIYYSLGKSYLEDNQYEKAISSLKEASRLSDRPQHYILDKLAQAYLKSNQLDQALNIYEEMPPFIRKPYILRNLGHLYLELGHWEEAEQTLEHAVKREPRNHNGRYFLGLAYQQNSKLNKAAAAFRQAIDLRQKNYNLDFPDAEAALSSLLEESPELEGEHSTQLLQDPITSDGRRVGRIEKYFDDRGFGFVTSDSKSENLFFHISEVNGRDTVIEGEFLEYQIGQGKKGPAAVDCCVVARLIEDTPG